MKRTYRISCIVAIILLLTGCSGGEGEGMKIKIGKIKVNDFNYEKKFEEEIEIEECSTIEKICAIVDVGNIDISYDGDDKMKVFAQYNVQTMTQKDMDDIINLLEIRTVVESDNISFTIAPEGIEENAWEWIRQRSEDKINLSVDLHISLPKKVYEYEVRVDTGSVMARDLEGAFKIQTDTGNIDINNIAINGSSSFFTNTGNIELALKESEIMGEIDIEVCTDTGNIGLDFGGMQYSTTEVKEDATEKNIEILGKCRVYASTDTGFISVK